MTIPDYKTYSLDDLYDVLNNIDKERYPQRVELIEKEIEYRKSNVSNSTVKDKPKEEIILKKEKSVFERYKITDLKTAKKAIRKAWLASLFLTIYFLVLNILAVNDVKFILNVNFSAYSFADVIVTGVITFGIFMKSRTFSIISVVYLISNYLYSWYKLGESNFGLLNIALLYFFYQGILGTFKYHQLIPKDIVHESNDEKVCPKCKTKNHAANYRCGCGYDFG